MRVALISDIHGNDLALQTVLADIRGQAVDRIACLGDVATLGPQPAEVIATLRTLGCPCIVGNHDEFLITPETLDAYTQVPVITQAVAWCRAQLSEADLAFVRTFVDRLEIKLDDQRTLLLFHGSPQSNTCDVLTTTDADILDQMLGGQCADVMAGGHTHIQMLRQHRGMLLVNPGSVGMPFRQYVAGKRPEIMPYAEYAIVTAQPGGPVSVDLRRVPLDKHALRDATRRWPNAPSLLRDDMLLQYA